LQAGISKHGIRISAPELEKVVVQELALAFDQPLLLVERAGLQLHSGDVEQLKVRCANLVEQLRDQSSSLIRQLISKVEVARDRIAIDVETAALASHLNLPGS
jgi:hypothetical protein